MKNRILAVVVAVALLLLVPVSAAVNPSVQTLSWDGDNHCTVFSINEREGYWGTAYHCVEKLEAFEIGGQPAEVVIVNKLNDAAVLKSAFHAKALRLADHAPLAGQAITIVGHPLGFIQQVTAHGELLLPDLAEYGTIWNLYDLTAAPGNSGSPVMTKYGVIGILNFGWPDAGRLGGGTAWPTLHALQSMGYWVN